jgi:hypothetical protein
VKSAAPGSRTGGSLGSFCSSLIRSRQPSCPEGVR